jgi:pyruvate/2-oxoglutarate dehydrogenase complex dihydrolipoamide dehydrogenase (E3) component
MVEQTHQRRNRVATEHYQNLVIGSGEAGKFLTWHLARSGQRTVVVERGAFGGACPNVACLPSKNVIYSAKICSLVNRAAEFGIATGPAKLNMAGVFRRKAKMVEALGQVHREKQQASGADLVFGEARFIEPKTVQVALKSGGTQLLRGDRVFLAVGTRASLPDVPGLQQAAPMTHVEALNLERLPEHLVVVGGGYVGLEFAQALCRFGSRVTVLERSSQLLGREDADVAEALLQLLADEGVTVLLNASIAKVAGRSGDHLQIQAQSGGTTTVIEASDMLVATGRTPNTDRLDAAKGGVELDARGYLRVNDRLETTAAGVWAMGECAGSPQFTHVSFDDFRIVRDNLAGGNRTTRGRLIPFCLFTDPELARVGINETEARTSAIPYRVVEIPMSTVLRTATHSETRGFAKALIGDDDRILGFTAFGAEASEMMAAVQTAMIGKVPYTALRDGIFAHPTTVEGLVNLFSSTPTPA